MSNDDLQPLLAQPVDRIRLQISSCRDAIDVSGVMPPCSFCFCFGADSDE